MSGLSSSTSRTAPPQRPVRRAAMAPWTRARFSKHEAPRKAARTAIGGLFLSTAGIHVGLVVADPEIYASFADQALFGWVRDQWIDVFMAHPAIWGLAVATGELSLGVLLLVGGRPARWGYAGVIGFHLALMLFGWGFWAWSVPALALLIPLARNEWRPG